jgi:ribosomal-protein-alanine N-acetyltransferase
MKLLDSLDRNPDDRPDTDLDSVMAVMDEAFDPCFGENWSRTQCSGVLASANSWTTISRVRGEPGGFALSRMIVDEAELLLIGVRPQYRRMGIGRDLLEQVAIAAATFGAKRLHLEVREGNDAAALYAAIGFEEVGRRRDYYRGANGQKFDAITLALPLPLNN